MYKLAVPININTFTKGSQREYLDSLKQCNVQRVFICGLGNIYESDSLIYTQPNMLKETILSLQHFGFEVGTWICSLGHGIVLAHDKKTDISDRYTLIEGINGDKVSGSYCPLDESFFRDYADGIRTIARFHPDIIMLDDDFRLNVRSSHLNCFCPLHLKEYYKRIGEFVPRARLESFIFSGGNNKYRSTYMKLSADTMLNFAKKLRSIVDEVDSTIRLGACTCFDNWDFVGTDAIELARAFAGDTLPFMRTIGAPYWNNNIIDVTENTRMQLNWCKDSDVEVFVEGDTYPRPRYNVPSAGLELFDLLLIADGGSDGIIKYMYDYVQKFGYETGYTDQHIKNIKLRDDVRQIFAGKSSVGVRSCNVMHKIENTVLPYTYTEDTVGSLINSYKSVSRNLLSKNSLPTAYGDATYPLLLCGENARYINKSDLIYGAILDIPAAIILQERGVDVGLITEETCTFDGEYFISEGDTIRNLTGAVLKKIQCNHKAKILSVFAPYNSPATYMYENADGLRFFVLAYDLYASQSPVCTDYCDNHSRDYANNYYRQSQLIEGIEWAGKRKLPAVCLKKPNLYIMASTDSDAMAVALANVSIDEIIEAEIKLDKEYKNIKFVNCNGKLIGDKVFISKISPYGFVAFEVK